MALEGQAGRDRTATRRRTGRRRGLPMLLGLLALFGSGCLVSGKGVVRVAPREIPPSYRELFAYAPAGDPSFEEVVRSRGDHEVRRVSLRVPGPRPDADRDMVFDYYRVLAPGRHPAVLVTPILEGKLQVSRVLARWLVGGGMHALVLHNPPEMLAADQDARAVEIAFRGSIGDLRRTLDWAVARPEVDPTRLGSAGVSLGAIRNSILAAIEPRLKAHALMLGGADVAAILMETSEKPVARYRRKRLEGEGMTEGELRESFRRAFHYDTEELMRCVDPSKVLLVLGRFDRVVPFERGRLLRRRMGYPETIVLPCGHYWSVPFLPFVGSRMIEHFRSRFRGDPG